jgi:hypothetical protein
MSETESAKATEFRSPKGEVTALRAVRGRDATNALRQRRYRKRRKVTTVTRRSTVTPVASVMPPVATPIPSPRNAGRSVTICATTVSALSLAGVSAGFAITGLTAVFIGAFWPVVAMGAALELGKLSAVAWLGRHQGSPAFRAALIALVAVLMGLNAIGAYGFLAKAHIGHAVAGDVAMAGRAADIEARLSVQAAVVADLTKQIADLDAARPVEVLAAGNLRTAAAINAQAAALAAAAKLHAADDERRQAKRKSMADQLAVEANAFAHLKIEKAAVEGERRTVEADLGPIRYLAALVDADSETALRWFVLVVALLLDPAAVRLLLAASSARR